MTVAIDGVTWILGCAVLVLTNNGNPIAYGLALCAGPGLAALLTARHRRRVGWSRFGRRCPASKDVSWLLIASAASMTMANLAPVVVTAMLPDAPAMTAGFAGAVVLTTVPLLFMGTAQAMLLPGMMAAAATGERAHFRATVARGLAVIAIIGVAAVLGTWLLGHPVISLLLGADRDTTDTAALVWLTVSAALSMAVQLLQPATVALRRYRALVFAWLAGAINFTAAFAVPVPPIDKGVLAQIVGPLVTLVTAGRARHLPSTADRAGRGHGHRPPPNRQRPRPGGRDPSATVDVRSTDRVAERTPDQALAPGRHRARHPIGGRPAVSPSAVGCRLSAQ